MHGLRDDFAGREMTSVTHLAGRAKHAAHRAADLRADTRGHAAGETHQHRLDARVVGKLEQIFSREAVARIRFHRRGERADAHLGGETRAHFRRQLGHRVERLGELQVEIVPQPVGVNRRKLPARESRAKFFAREIVEVVTALAQKNV